MYQSRGFTLVSTLLLSAASALAQSAAIDGEVFTGQHVPKDATVFITRAWPREGLAYCCPSCCRDCTRSARTDAQGKWRISGLDNALTFDLLVIADGCSPQVIPHVDPAKHLSIIVPMAPRDLALFSPERIVRGRIIDAAGKPVLRAEVSPQLLWNPDFRGGRNSPVDGLDPVAITDADGRFQLTCASPCAGMDLSVEARGFSQVCKRRVRSGETQTTIELHEGATISGQLTLAGRPLPNVDLQLCDVDRGGSGPNCFQRIEIGTNDKGRFEFVNLRAPGEYILCATMDSASKLGCIPQTRVQVGADGQIVELPPFAVAPGRLIAGRVIVPAGKTLPPDARVTLSANEAWDAASHPLAPDGRFEFANVPDGKFALSLDAPGLWISPRNASFNPSGKQLVGRVDRDTPDLLIELTDQEPARPGAPARSPDKELGGDDHSQAKETTP